MSVLAPSVEERFVYVDWTLEEQPRAFYIGKGNARRVRKRERNAYWQNIAAKYGWRREILFGIRDEAFAFEEEKRHITELGTFEDGTPGRWGANLTEGGEGASGYRHTDVAKRRMTEAKHGKPLSSTHRQRIGEASRRQVITNEWRERVSAGRRGIPVSEETKQKIATSLRGRQIPKDVVARIQRRCGEESHAAKLTWDIVHEIRKSQLTGRQLANLYNVSESTISAVRHGHVWKENSA